jgi:sarcosine oxidase gamma subunit
LVVVGIGGYSMGPTWAREYLKNGVRVEIAEALPRERPGQARAGLGRAAEKLRSAVDALAADEVQVRLRVRNQTAVPARIRSARYSVRIGGREIGQGAWVAPGGPQWFLPGRDAEIVASLHPNWGVLASAGIDAASGREARISVSGQVTVALLGDGFAVPFEVSRVGWTR